jgi:predicted glycosyltransferase
MKHRVLLSAALAVCSCILLVFVPTANSQEQSAAAQKLQNLSQVLNLSPQQKSQLAPILEAEAPKVQAIKENPSLSGREKMKQLKAVHEQTDPLVKSILNPTQYEQWQTIRKEEIEAMKKGGG